MSATELAERFRQLVEWTIRERRRTTKHMWHVAMTMLENGASVEETYQRLWWGPVMGGRHDPERIGR